MVRSLSHAETLSSANGACAGPAGSTSLDQGQSASPPASVAPVVSSSKIIVAGAVIAGRYALVERIGSGGMAEVWRATHTELRTDVALKFLDADLVNHEDAAPILLSRFRFEAQVSAKLGAHTRHVVSVHDAGIHRGIPYLAMELIDGHDLEREVEKNGPLPPEAMAAIVDQIADALDAAHQLGIVHRDLKPSNVLLLKSPAGGGAPFVKVADFGVAKATRDSNAFDNPRATAAGLLVGSPAFMSPEQVAGATDIDGRSDIWSLGTLVYEGLSGKNCFDGRTLTETLVAVSTRTFAPLHEVRPDIGKNVDVWLERCFAMQPSDRFPTMIAAARSFRQALATAAEPPPEATYLPKPIGKGALWIAAACTIVLGVAGYTIWSLQSTSNAATLPNPPPSAVQSTAPVQPSPPPTVSTDSPDSPIVVPNSTVLVQTSSTPPKSPATALPTPAIPAEPTVTAAPTAVPQPTAPAVVPKPVQTLAPRPPGVRKVDPSETH